MHADPQPDSVPCSPGASPQRPSDADRLALRRARVQPYLLVLFWGVFLASVVTGLLARSTAPTWRSLSGHDQARVLLGTFGGFLYCVYGLYCLGHFWRNRRTATRAAHVGAVCLVLGLVVMVVAGALQWTSWPFDVAFYYEREQVAEWARSAPPYDGSIQVGEAIYRGPFDTDAGPLFRSLATPYGESGYLHRPEGPPPAETWVVVGDGQHAAARACIHFREAYPLPSGWYAVVWEWGQRQPIETAVSSPASTTAAGPDDDVSR